MNEYEQQLSVEARTALQKYFAQIRLARATDLAQAERLLEAEAVLVQNGELPRSASELDLLARIAARQGRFDEARLRWKAALQVEPGSDTYRQCLEHLTPARRAVRIIANSQATLLTVYMWVVIAFTIAACIYTFCY